jgi:CubicO group peptidase (beta-lactamase class C family)
MASGSSMQSRLAGRCDADLQAYVAPGYEPVRDALSRVAARGDSCAVAAFHRGKLVADMWAGPGFTGRTLVGVYSVTKGMAAICVALLVQRGLLDPDAPVCAYWPEFAAAGKESVTVRMLLSHQAGLVGLAGCSLDDLLSHDGMTAALAAAAPLWQPGSAHGYHALTMGVLADELVRRTAGFPLGQFFEREVRAPLDADCYLGLPAELEPRVLPIAMAPASAGNRGGAAAAADASPPAEHDFAAVALSGRPEFPAITELPNLRSVRAAGPPSFGGVASARGLASIYAACLGWPGQPGLLTAETIARVTGIQVRGRDLVLGKDTRYALVFQKPDERLPFGSWQAFGHDGAGGSLAFADPAHDLSFAYVTGTFRTQGAGLPAAYELLRQIRRCIESSGAR